MSFDTFPASSPASWHDWENIGTTSEPIMYLKQASIQKYERKDGNLFCLHIKQKYKMKMKAEDQRRCNTYHDCLGGQDETDCSIFLNPKIHITLGISGLVILLGVVLWVFLNYFQLLDVDADISVIYQGNPSTKVIDSLVREIFNNKRNWD